MRADPESKMEKKARIQEKSAFLHLHNLQLYKDFQKFTDYILV